MKEPCSHPIENEYRTARCLNGRWDFQPVPVDRERLDAAGVPLLPAPAPEGWSDTPLTVPSPWNGNAWGGHTNAADPAAAYRADGIYYPDYPEEWIHVQMGWLRRRFTLGEIPAGRITLYFGAVAGEATVILNGVTVGVHFDNWLPFEVDITGAVKPGENELLVGIRGHHLFDVQSKTYKLMRRPYPTGSNTEGMCGIWQDVYLCVSPLVRVEDVFMQPLVDRDVLKAEVTVENADGVPRTLTVKGSVRDTALTFPEKEITLQPGETARVTLETEVRGALALWSPDTPALYTAEIRLEGADCYTQRFGWRQFSIKGRDLTLNGAPIHLVGDICHPFGPYMFNREFVRCWYGMIKEVGGNAVRLHAQIYPSFFLEAADEMGLAVLDETGIFGSNLAANLEEPAAWPRFEAHYDGLIRRDRNHPSVFGWSFGNELFALFIYDEAATRDQAGFYEKLIAFGKRAYALDPTRDFVTCDGDEDMRGAFPVWSKHFGHGLHPLPEVDKPIVIGESGGTYYARPEQFADFNGEDSFKSYAGRNHALGIDVYQNIRHMVKRLAYFSPSELVWFGLEPLPYGYHDFSRLPDLTDGIFFPEPPEGTPGLWYRRLPPFVGTLNPGWDPALPPYRPLDMFHAVKDALTFDPQYDEKWAPRIPTLPAPPKYKALRAPRLVGDLTGQTARLLTAAGLKLGYEGDGVIVDAATASEKAAKDAMAQGGTVLVLLGDEVPGWLPGVTLTDRTATQLERAGADPLVDSLAIGETYTAEEREDKYICRHGLIAPGAVLLKAGEADWSQFNNVEERVKCGAAFLYEHLQKPAGAVLVRLPDGTLVTTARLADTASHRRFWRRLFQNMGWELGEPIPLAETEAVVHDLLLNGPIE